MKFPRIYPRILPLALLFCALSCGQHSNSQNLKTGIEVELVGSLENCPSDTLLLYDVYSWGSEVLAKVPVTKGISMLNYKVFVPAKGMYALGFAENNRGEILLGFRPKINLTGSGTNMAGTLVTVGSPENEAYRTYNERLVAVQKVFNQLQTDIQAATQTGNSDQAATKNIELSQALNRFADYQDSLLKTSDLAFRPLLLLQYFRPYRSDSKYGTELDYVKSEFLTPAMLKDTAGTYYPMFQEKVAAYINYLAGLRQGETQIIDELKSKLALLKPGTRAYKHFLVGCVIGAARLQATDMYVEFADLFATAFPAHPRSESLAADVKKFGTIRVGKPAPEIEQSDVNGNPLKLSSLKGKVVLLDFWASWCGPCRRENPNVVAAYAKYKAKGFEVFSVSLDTDKGRWQDAIQKDGLVWSSHVSDLKGWSNAAAKNYGASSIPFTLLLDRDGKVIAKNLRGSALEEMLAKLLP